MTLPELASYMKELGCQEAMNLDGGGSTELWMGGRIMNSPCYGHERETATSLVVVRKPANSVKSGPEPAAKSEVPSNRN
jgi:exopolysaccharide biosynthesis protein